MACHGQALSALNGYRAWIRTMNNASKALLLIYKYLSISKLCISRFLYLKVYLNKGIQSL